MDTTDLDALCIVGSNIWLAHEWSVLGPCRRCGMPFPKIYES